MTVSNEVLEERNKSLSERVVKLENNQRFGVIAILTLVIKSLFDVISKGQIP